MSDIIERAEAELDRRNIHLLMTPMHRRIMRELVDDLKAERAENGDLRERLAAAHYAMGINE